MKAMVIKDLTELVKLGLCDNEIVEAVKSGVFDDDIKDMDNLKVHEISDQIMLLNKIK